MQLKHHVASKKALTNFVIVTHTDVRKDNYYLCLTSILTKSSYHVNRKIMRWCLNWAPPAMHVSNSTRLLRQKMEGNYSNAQFNCSFSTQTGHFGLCVESRPQGGQERKKGTPWQSSSQQTPAIIQVRWRRAELSDYSFKTVNPPPYQSRH